MSRLLLIAFDPAEAPAGAGLAAELGMPFDVLSFGGAVDTDLGAGAIRVVDGAEFPPTDALTTALTALVGGYSHIASVSSMRSKDVLARLAGLMDMAMVTDVIAVESPTVGV